MKQKRWNSALFAVVQMAVTLLESASMCLQVSDWVNQGIHTVKHRSVIIGNRSRVHGSDTDESEKREAGGALEPTLCGRRSRVKGRALQMRSTYGSAQLERSRGRRWRPSTAQRWRKKKPPKMWGWGLPGGLVVKSLPCSAGAAVQSLVWKLSFHRRAAPSALRLQSPCVAMKICWGLAAR